MKFRLIAAFCAFSLVSLAAHADNLVSNPTFAPDNTANYGYGPVAGWSQLLSAPLSGFPYLSGSNVYGQPFYGPGSGIAPATTVGFIQTFGATAMDTLSTTTPIATVEGATYDYSFYESARAGNDPTVTVTIGDQTLSAAHSDPAGSFVFFSGSFVADANGETLNLIVSQPGGQDQTALFTDVSVSAAPEPSSLILLGTGLIGAAGATRRKLRKA